MSVTATITPGAAAGARELQAALANARVVFMVDRAACAELEQALSKPEYRVQNKVIARGQDAVPGRDGYFEPNFHAGIQPGHIGDNGAMDFFDRELLKPVDQDEYIGQLHQPIQGIAGRRVDGSEIKVAAVRPCTLRIAPSLRVTSDGRVYAAQAGVVLYSAEKTLEIAQRHEHRGDVDLRSGSLDMQGALCVRGNVQRLFSVRATGDVEIQGGVDCGSVYSGKKLEIRNGIRGGDSGMPAASNVTPP
jgi:uncharacterized protein (DUF342 family)